MKKTKHMTGVDMKYWFAYYISINARMIYTHTLTRTRDSVNVNSHVTHTLTEEI
jgi:hypothetical protein